MQHRLHAPRQTSLCASKAGGKRTLWAFSGFIFLHPDAGTILGEEPSSPVTPGGPLAEDGRCRWIPKPSPRRVISFSSRGTHSPTARPQAAVQEDAGGAPNTSQPTEEAWVRDKVFRPCVRPAASSPQTPGPPGSP